MKPRNSYLMGLPMVTACLALLFAAQALWAQETTEKVTVDDVDRNFLVRLPKGYDPQHHYPVMILLHGMNQDPADIERLTRFNELADKDGVVAVYPLALHGRWNVGVRAQERRPTAMGREAVVIPEAAVAIPEGAAGTRAEEVNNRPRAVPRARKKEQRLPMTLRSSTSCSISSTPSFLWTRREFMRRACPKAVS